MGRIEAAIFDVGQVLHSYDPKPIHRDIMNTLGISQDQFRQNWNPLTIKLELGIIIEDEYWKKFKEETGSTATLPEESLLVRKYGEGFSVFDDVLDVAKTLKKQGIKIAILSNSIEPHYQFNKKVGLYDEFPTQVFSHQVGLRKPDSKIYELTLNQLGITPEKALFIDDRDENIEAAKNLGINGHIFTSSELLIKDLEERFQIVIK